MDDEWTELFSEKHQKKYWKNKSTGQSTWKNPNAEGASQSSKAKPPPTKSGEAATNQDSDEWQELFSEKHNKKYWKNKKTGQSSWKPPSATINEDSQSLKIDKQDDVNQRKETADSTVSDEWEEHFSQKHNRKYWKSRLSGKSSWTKPEQSGTSQPETQAVKDNDGSASVTSTSVAPVVSSGEEWVESYSEKHKRKYWKNKATGKTSWTKPIETEAKVVSEIATSVVPKTTSTADEWEEKFSDKHNRKYWKNKVTGKSSWTAPANDNATAPPTASTTPVNVPAAADEEWEELFSQKHNRKYWKNKESGKTSWTKPEVKAKSPAVPADGVSKHTAQEQSLASDWVESYSEKHKRKYWKNKTTGKTSWTDPAGAATPRSVAPSAPPSLAPSAAPSTVASPLTVSSDVAKVESENKATFRSLCFIQDSTTASASQFVAGSHFIEVLVGENDSVVRTMQIQNYPVVTDTAESILPSMEHFPEKGCGILDEWGTGSAEINDSSSFAPFSAITLKKQTDADQGIVTKTNILFPGISLLPNLVQSQLSIPLPHENLNIDFFQQYGRFTEAYETTRALGNMIELEAAFAVGDSSSYKLITPESSLGIELESKENAVLFHLTDYKKVLLQNESLKKNKPEDSARKFPTSGILPLRIIQNVLGSSRSSFAVGKQDSNSRWMPCWIDVDIPKHCIHFHEQGPKLPATFTLSCDSADIQFSDTNHVKQFELELTSCTMISTVTGSLPSNSSGYGVRLNFASQDEMVSWYYTLTLAIFGNAATRSYRLDASLISSFGASGNSWKSSNNIQDAEEERFGCSCSDTLLEIEKKIADHQLAVLNLRIVQVSSMQLKSMKLQVMGGRTVVAAQGKCVKIPAGSILLSMNGISAVDLPSHTIVKFITDLPKQMMVDVTFLKPVSAQYSAEMMMAIPPRVGSKAFSVTEESPFSPKKTFPITSRNNNIANSIASIDPIATKIANQAAFDETLDWSSCNVLLLGDSLTVSTSNSSGNVAHRFPLATTTMTLTRPSYMEDAKGTNHNGRNACDLVSTIFMEIAHEQKRMRLRIPIRAQFHTMLRSIIAGLKLYGGLSWNLDAIRSLNEQVSKHFMTAVGTSDEEIAPRDITNISVLLSQSQLESNLATSEMDNSSEQNGNEGLDASILKSSPTKMRMSLDDLQSVGASVQPAVPEVAQSEESIIDAAESLQALLQELHLPPQFPTASIIEKLRQEMRSSARKNVQLMANVLSAQVEACYPASAFTKMSMAPRDSDMVDENKDGENSGGTDDNDGNAVNFDENGANSYMDGDENNLIAPIPSSTVASARRRSSVSMNTPITTNSMDAMQQRQFNKAARRASRLSINMDMAAVFSMGTSAPTLSTPASTIQRQTLKNGAKLSAEERSAICVIFNHFRSHPDDLLNMATKLSTFQDMLSFAFIIVQRFYSPLSTDQNKIEDLLRASFQLRPEKEQSFSAGANIVSAGHHIERVPFFAHESRVIQSFDDFSQNLHQKLLFSHQKNSISIKHQTQPVNKVTMCLLYELYCRPEIIAFLEGLVPRLTTDSLSPDSGVADMCSKIVEPICARLFDAAERKQLPMLLKVILRAIHRYSQHQLNPEDFVSIILTPYVCNILVDSQVQRGLAMDPSSQHIVHRARDLLFACFDQSLGKRLQLSLSDSAALSRSRWFVSRAMEVFVEDDRPFPSSGVAKLVMSPVATLANMHAESNRPKALESFMCLKPSELLFMLKIFDLSSIATSLLVSTSRAISESMSILSASDLLSKLNGYVITNASASTTQSTNTATNSITPGMGATTIIPGGINSSNTSIHRRAYLPTVLDRDLVYIFDLDENEKDKDPLLDLLDDEDLVSAGANPVRNYFDVTPVGNGNNNLGGGNDSTQNASGLFTSSEEESMATNELQVINWLVAAARTSLKNVFEHVTKVHSVHTVRELHELRDKLRAKLPMIRAILGDWQSLQAAQELLRSHQSQISLLHELYKSRKLKNEFFKGPSTMIVAPPTDSSALPLSTASSSASGIVRFPVLIAAMRMIYVDYIEIRPVVLAAVVDEDKEHLLIRIYHQHMQLEMRLLLQRLSEAIQPIGNYSLRHSISASPHRPKAAEDALSSSGHVNHAASSTPRTTRNMNPLLVIMQNVFPAHNSSDT